MDKPKVNQLKAGAMLSYVNLALSCVIPILYTPIMLRILGQAEYGVYSLSSSVISYLSVLQFGMGSACIRYITKSRTEGTQDDVERAMGLFLCVYSVLTGIVLVCGLALTALSDLIFATGLTQSEIATMKTLMIFMMLNIALSFPLTVFSSIIASYEKYVFSKCLDTFSTLTVPILNLVILYNGFRSVGMTIVSLSVQIIIFFANVFYVTRVLHVHAQFKNMPTRILHEVVGFSGFVFLASIVDMLYWATDKVLIGAMIGSVATAIYNVGGTFTSMLQNMSSAISNVFIPRVNTMVFQKKSTMDLTALLIKVGRIQYAIVAFVLTGYIVFGQRFIHFWSGDEYAQAYYVALMTMLPLVIPLIENVAFNVILAENKHRFRSILYAVIAVINLIGTWLLIPKYGILGASACTCVAFLLGHGVCMNMYYHRVIHLDIPLFWKNILSMSIIPVIMTIAGFYVTHTFVPETVMGFLGQIVVYSIIYLSLTFKFSLNDYERNLICDLIRKATSIVRR